MVKDVLKKIILFIISIYFILSLIFTCYQYNENRNYYKHLEFSHSNQSHTETISLPDGENFLTWMKGNVYTGKSIIINDNIKIIAFSIFLGTFLGLVVSAKKSKVSRYMVFYIIGNIFLNCILSILYYTEFNYFNMRIYDIYIEVLEGFFMLYTIIFLLTVVCREAIKKFKKDKKA